MSIAFLLTTLVVVATPAPVRVLHRRGPVPRLPLYGVFAATMRTQVISRPDVMLWLRRTFAATYVLLAGRLAAESR